jgi:phosphatidylglycerol:prolipoprotein diacylglycerol transferase
MTIHTIFDVLAWLSGAAVAVLVSQRGWLSRAVVTRTPFSDPYYFVALGIGAIGGALLFGSYNLDLAGRFELGHSIAGAIAGGVVAIELFKLATGVRGSTGAQFVAPLAAGIAVGRWGCFFAGIPDYTYGTPTNLPWGVDFGDGVTRHPVQLYESFSMLAFLVVYLVEIARQNAFVLRQGFYLFVGFYALQRFAWEFLKPYPRVAGPFNIFHMLCAALLAYSLLMMSRNYEPVRETVPEL